MVNQANNNGWMNAILAPFSKCSKNKSSLGKLWMAHESPSAYRAGEMNSVGGSGEPVRVCFRNASSVPIMICWIDNKGNPYHFYKMRPKTSQELNSPVTSLDHIEHTKVGDSFAFAYVGADENNIDECKKLNKMDPDSVISGYCPQSADDEKIHLVTISHTRRKFVCGCIPVVHPFLRGSSKHSTNKKNDDETIPLHESDYPKDNDVDDYEWTFTVQPAELDETPYDTSSKHYECSTMGGWPVRVEPDWHGNKAEFCDQLEKELQYAYDHLPEHAREFLCSNTPVWINKEIKWGPKACPIDGKGLCFHGEKQWVVDNGLTPEKAGCVELHNAQHYFDNDRELWGCGGVMIHEFSHAYHHKYCEDGYANKDIKDCYDMAMKEGIYDCVRVHGAQGPTAKAYACTNCMEYFAELSTAFLGTKSLNEEEEYNKWFPFNRKQIKEHDPRAYKMLQKIWKVQCEDDGGNETEVVAN